MDRHDLARITPFSEVGYTGRFDEAFCNKYMSVGDPLSDEVIESMRTSGYQGATGAGDQLEQLGDLARSKGGIFEELYTQTHSVPSWVNRDMIVEGQRVITNTHPYYGMSLFHSLFTGASFSRAALVTNSTGRLGGDPRRRITETSAMIFALAADDGHLPGQLGHDIVVKVRLLHSSIRYWIVKNGIADESWAGVPIDQTMLAITNSLFSYINIRSLLRLGVLLTDDQIAAHHHLWRYVSWLLGIDEALLTDSVTEERDLWHAVAKHQGFPELLGGDVFINYVAKQAGRLSEGGRQAKIASKLFGDMMLYLSGPDWVGGVGGPKMTPSVALLKATAVPASAADRWVPGASDWKRKRVLKEYDRALASLRNHDYGVETEEAEDNGVYRANAEAALTARFGS